MTAGTIITLDLIDMAHAALHVAMDSTPGSAVKAAMVSLGDALDLYAGLYDDAGGTDPDGAALWAAAEAVENAAGALIAAMAAPAAESGTEDIGNAVAGVATK